MIKKKEALVLLNSFVGRSTDPDPDKVYDDLNANYTDDQLYWMYSTLCKVSGRPFHGPYFKQNGGALLMQLASCLSTAVSKKLTDPNFKF